MEVISSAIHCSNKESASFLHLLRLSQHNGRYFTVIAIHVSWFCPIEEEALFMVNRQSGNKSIFIIQAGLI